MAPRKNKLTDKQQAFLEWLCVPSGLREPSTQMEWGRQNQCGQTALKAWKKDPTFRLAWDARLSELQVDPEKIDEVMTALFKKATIGDTKAISMYLEVADRFRPAPEAPVEQRTPLAEMSEADLQALLGAHIEDELAERADAK